VLSMHGWVIRDDYVTIETRGGDLELADPEDVERYWRATRLLLEASVTGVEAALLARQVRDELTNSPKTGRPIG
jgi:hypothetical protein